MEKNNSSYKTIEIEEEKTLGVGYSETSISIVCPSPKGEEIALKLQKHLNAKLYIKESYKNLEVKVSKVPLDGEDFNENLETNVYRYGEDFKLNDVTKEVMKTSKGVIFISSTGIAVRAIAPFLEGKDKDSGVVVVDLSSKYAINILSGHLGGGNELTLEVAKILNVQPIITTATDNLGIIAPDILAKDNALIIEDLKKAKYIASLLVDEKIIGIKDDCNIINITKGYEKVEELRENCIWITHNLKNTAIEDDSKILKLIKKDLVLGIGCRRGTSYEKLNDFINSSLVKNNLDIRATAFIVSVDVKANEEGLIKLAQKMDCPFKTFKREEIESVQDKYEKSEFVLKTLGITGVCEPCVDLAGADVIISKLKHEGMTLAIGVLK